MIHLHLATEAGIREITPASLTHRAGCEQEYYLDGPADSDPHFCCRSTIVRTDRQQVARSASATNPVIVEEMRLRARMPYTAIPWSCLSRGAPPPIEFDPCHVA